MAEQQMTEEMTLSVLRTTLMRLNSMSEDQRQDSSDEQRLRFPTAKLDTEEQGGVHSVVLRSGVAEEHFTLSGSTLRGRGGNFDLQYPTEASAVILTVLGREQVPENEEDEDGILSSALFLGASVSRSVLPVRFKYHAWIKLLTITCGSQVVWLIQHDEDHHDMDSLSHWTHNSTPVCAYKSFVTQESLVMAEHEGEALPGRNVFPMTPTSLAGLLTGQCVPEAPSDIATNSDSPWHRAAGTSKQYIELARQARALRGGQP